MTTLIFATEGDASPLIHLAADPGSVRIALLKLQPLKGISCGAAAVEFLRRIPDYALASWAPTLQSVPIEGSAAIDLDYAAFDGDMLAWNPSTWEEIDLSPEQPPLGVVMEEM